MVEGKYVPREMLVKDVPKKLHNDLDYIISMIDWEENVDPEFVKHHYLEPKPVEDMDTMSSKGYVENWVTYGSEEFSTKELTVFPDRKVKILDKDAYGLILVQGRGTIGKMAVETPTMIRFGELTKDELFVSYETARGGVTIRNTSESEDLVMLKHFGPGNPDTPV
jgi:hypothetical protein